MTFFAIWQHRKSTLPGKWHSPASGNDAFWEVTFPTSHCGWIREGSYQEQIHNHWFDDIHFQKWYQLPHTLVATGVFIAAGPIRCCWCNPEKCYRPLLAVFLRVSVILFTYLAKVIVCEANIIRISSIYNCMVPIHSTNHNRHVCILMVHPILKKSVRKLFVIILTLLRGCCNENYPFFMFRPWARPGSEHEEGIVLAIFTFLREITCRQFKRNLYKKCLVIYSDIYIIFF